MRTIDHDAGSLADGLVLRAATPADLPSIQTLLADRGDDSDA